MRCLQKAKYSASEGQSRNKAEITVDMYRKEPGIVTFKKNPFFDILARKENIVAMFG